MGDRFFKQQRRAPSGGSGGVAVLGVEDLIAAIGAFDQKLKRKILSKALRAGAKVMHSKARQLVPVRTGALRESLKVRVRGGGKRRGGAKVRVGVFTGKRAELGITDGSYYPAALEFGTSKMPAHPYMRPAFEASKETARSAAIDVLRSEIQKG